MELDENVRVVDGSEEDMQTIGREKEERKAKRLSTRKHANHRMLSRELKKEKKKAGMDEEVIALNNSYQEMFEATLEYFEVSNIRDLPEEKKKEFFAVIDMALEEAKMSKKDHDGDGEVETSTAEYMGSRDKAIKKSMKKESFEDNEKRRAKARADMKAGKYNKDGSLKDDDKKPAIKLRGFGPDAAKGNMSNPAARASLMKKEEVEIDDPMVELVKEYITSKQVKMAKGIANDPRHKGGDYTGAADKMEKIKKGLSNHPAAKKALRQANEELTSQQKADRMRLIARAADRVHTGAAAKAVEKRAKADMKQKGAQKGMAKVKSHDVTDYIGDRMKEEVAKLRKMIKENNNKAEAYKLLAKILNTAENLGEQ